MIIIRILLGAIVGFVAGLMITGLALLVWLRWEFVFIAWGLCAIAGLCVIAGVYLAFVNAVSTKALLHLALGFVVVFLFNLGFGPNFIDAPPTTIRLRHKLERCSCEPDIQKEVDDVLTRFDGMGRNVFSECPAAPALARFSISLGGTRRACVVEPNPLASGMPSHLRIRLGYHFYVQYIYFFRSGTDASLIKLSEHVTGNIYNMYFDPRQPHASYAGDE